MRNPLLLALLGLFLALPAQAQAPAPTLAPTRGPTHPGTTAAERWLWDSLRGPLTRPEFAVNMAGNCNGATPSATEPNHPAWAEPCRAITAEFLETILTTEPWRSQLPRRGLRLQGMLVQGVLDLSATQISVELWLDQSRFPEPVILTGAKFDKALTFDGSALEGGFSADQFQVGGNLQLSGARIGCLVEAGPANAPATTPCGPMVLQAATIGGDLRLEGADIRTGLSAEDMTLAGSLHLTGTRIAGGLHATNLKVSRNLYLDAGAELRCTPVAEVKGCDALVLRGATVEGQFTLLDSTLGGHFQGNSLKAHNHLQLRNTSMAPGARLNLANARIDGDLDLSNAALGQVSLAGIVIGGDLQLATDSRAPPRWAPDALLSLRNARVGAVQGSLEPGRNAWPAQLELQGFTYERLGGGTQDASSAMLSRPSAELVDWLARDRSFTRQPYQQLAGIFTAAGDPNRATDILFAARYREEQQNWQQGAYADAVGLAALRITIGYGLGYKFFRVLWWVLGFCLIGTLVLWQSPAARARGLLWCFGASLDQLIPFATLSPEFAPFFDDPRRERLANWQMAFFAMQALVGFVLGGFVGAGMGGLTQAN